MPYSVSGVTEKNYHGTGVIVDAKRGLVVIDRNTVPLAMGDVRITFNGTVEVPGKVEFIHPLHNLAVVSYDPALDRRRRRCAPRRFVDQGAAPRRRCMGRRPAQRFEGHVAAHPGRERRSRRLPAVTDACAFATAISRRSTWSMRPNDLDGVLADEKGEVLALWSSFAFETQRELEQVNRGIPADLVTEMINAVSSTSRQLYSFEAEFNVQSLASARKLGLTDDWVKRFEEHDAAPAGPRHRPAGGRRARGLAARAWRSLARDRRQGRQPLPRGGARRAEARRRGHRLARRRGPKTLKMQTVALNGRDIDRVVIWAGATLQAPHRAMAAQRGIAP